MLVCSEDARVVRRARADKGLLDGQLWWVWLRGHVAAVITLVGCLLASFGRLQKVLKMLENVWWCLSLTRQPTNTTQRKPIRSTRRAICADWETHRHHFRKPTDIEHHQKTHPKTPPTHRFHNLDDWCGSLHFARKHTDSVSGNPPTSRTTRKPTQNTSNA